MCADGENYKLWRWEKKDYFSKGNFRAIVRNFIEVSKRFYS